MDKADRFRLVVGRSMVRVAALAAALVIASCAGADSPDGIPEATVTSTTSVPEMSPPPTTASDSRPGSTAAPIVVGVEYILLDNPRLIDRQAELLRDAGFHASKPIGEAIEWGAMQTGPDQPIDFSKLDRYVRSFQEAGMAEVVLALKSHSTWASIDHALLRSRNAAPKAEFVDDYETWITAVVERYDGDGIDDMDGLAYPVRHYEIGSEFSSYEPEPVDEYLAMLEVAYAAAHAAFADVSVAHAAFLVTDFLLDDPSLDEIDDDTGVDRYGPHSFSEIRAILDRPDLFDVLNIHALAHPGEIDQMVRWLELETAQRGYTKPIIISDTSINPFISFGPAVVCDRPARAMGLMIYPAAEDDRCRLADYFNRILDGDPETVEWMRGFVAADMVKKVVIAAEHRILLINTAFTIDLPLLDSRVGQAGAGNAGWGGMIDLRSNTRYPNFYALKQLLGHIDGYTAVTRLDVGGAEGTRVYEFVRGSDRVVVAWYDPPFVVVHGDAAAQTTITLDIGADARLEPMISLIGQESATSMTVPANPAGVELTLDQAPVFLILPEA